ncbi:MAG: hypothetical protein VW907_06400 [Opitutae bacterium]
MSVNFPDSPTVGDTYTLGATWRWDGSTWSVTSRSADAGSSSSVETFAASTTPTGASEGAFWFNTVDSSLSVYHNSAWVSVGGEGAPVVFVQETQPSGTAAGELWYQESSETIFVYSGSQWLASSNGVSVTASQTTPSSAVEGDLWFDSTTADLFLYFGSQWLQVGGNILASVTVQETAPTTASEGDLWFQSSTGLLYARYNGQWLEVGANATSLIQDTDGDTLIQVEEGIDEDVIRFDTAGSERMIIDASGNVGIGTTSPIRILDIQGASDPEIRLQSTDSSNPAIYFGDQVDSVRGGIRYNTASNRLEIQGYNNATGIAIEATGGVAIGGSAVISGGVTLGSGGTEFTLPTTDGTENQVLRTNGSGAISWVDRDLVTVNHGATASTARPTGADKVMWIGTADPSNKVTGDIWLDLT